MACQAAGKPSGLPALGPGVHWVVSPGGPVMNDQNQTPEGPPPPASPEAKPYSINWTIIGIGVAVVAFILLMRANDRRMAEEARNEVWNKKDETVYIDVYWEAKVRRNP